MTSSPGVRCGWSGCANPRSRNGVRCWIPAHSGPELTSDAALLVPPPVLSGAPDLAARRSEEEKAARSLLASAVDYAAEVMGNRGVLTDNSCTLFGSERTLGLVERSFAGLNVTPVFVRLDESSFTEDEEDTVAVVVYGWEESPCVEGHGCADPDDCALLRETDEEEVKFFLPPARFGLDPSVWYRYDEFRQWSADEDPFTPEEAALATREGWDRSEDLDWPVPRTAEAPVTLEGQHLRRLVEAAAQPGWFVDLTVPVPLRARLGEDVRRVGAADLTTCTAAPHGLGAGEDLSDWAVVYAYSSASEERVRREVYVPLVEMTPSQAELYSRLRSDGTPRVEAEFFALNV